MMPRGWVESRLEPLAMDYYRACQSPDTRSMVLPYVAGCRDVKLGNGLLESRKDQWCGITELFKAFVHQADRLSCLTFDVRKGSALERPVRKHIQLERCDTYGTVVDSRVRYRVSSLFTVNSFYRFRQNMNEGGMDH